MIFRKFKKWWTNYKYRFVPWVAWTWKKRSMNEANISKIGKLLTDQQVEEQLTRLFIALHKNSKTSLAGSDENHTDRSNESNYNKSREMKLQPEVLKYRRSLEILSKVAGFTIERGQSTLKDGGTGVLVTSGSILPCTVTAIYPGLVYFPGEPLLLQSIRNSFILRCVDGIHIDGNDRHPSKFFFRSCVERDRVGYHRIADMSWLTSNPKNPLAIGQYVNNQTSGSVKNVVEKPANVAYQEFDLPAEFPFDLLKFIPNANYRSQIQDLSNRRIVVLISLRQIEKGEELFSSYYTEVQ